MIQWFSVDSENLSIQCDLPFSELYLEVSGTVGTVIRPVRLLIQESGWVLYRCTSMLREKISYLTPEIMMLFYLTPKLKFFSICPPLKFFFPI